MADVRLPPDEFVRRLRLWPDFHELRWNAAVQRWEFILMSAAGRPVSQFYGWDHNPLTGEPIEPDPVSGLLPFRDLTPDAQEEIIRLGNATYIANRGGPGTPKELMLRAMKHNRELAAARRRQRAQDWADANWEIAKLARRPGWLKEHQPSKQKLIITPR